MAESIQLAVLAYSHIVTVALPISIVFHLGNRLISAFTGAATGGVFRF